MKVARCSKAARRRRALLLLQCVVSLWNIAGVSQPKSLPPNPEPLTLMLLVWSFHVCLHVCFKSLHSVVILQPTSYDSHV